MEGNQATGGHKSSNRLGTEIKKGKVRLRIEVLHYLDDTANAGLFCKYCILDALYKLDDRTRPG